MTWLWYWLGNVAVLLLFAWLIRLLAHADAHQAFLSRWCAQINTMVGMSRFEFSRTVIPVALLSFTACLMGFLVIPVVYIDQWSSLALDDESLVEDVALVAELVLLGVIVLLALATLITKRTGRPKILVLKPCREMSKTETEKWLSPPK